MGKRKSIYYGLTSDPTQPNAKPTLGITINPFRSEAQRRWMWAKHPAMAKKWAKHTPKGKALPERVKNKLASRPGTGKKSPFELAASLPKFKATPVPFAGDQTSYPPYSQIGGSPVSGTPDDSQQPPAEPWPNGVVIASNDPPQVGPPNPGPGGPAVEMSEPRLTFTATEQKVLALLSDGMPHPRKQVFAVFGDPHMTPGAMSQHMFRIRTKLRLIGQDVICGIAGRRSYYQQVRLMLRTDAPQGK